MTLQQRLVLAQAHARSIVLPEEGPGLGPGPGEGQGPGQEQGPGSGGGPGVYVDVNSSLPHGDARIDGHRLRLGFISYDFNDHPTAHLVEAIFDVVRLHRRGASSRGASSESSQTVRTNPPTTLIRQSAPTLIRQKISTHPFLGPPIHQRFDSCYSDILANLSTLQSHPVDHPITL